MSNAPTPELVRKHTRPRARLLFGLCGLAAISLAAASRDQLVAVAWRGLAKQSPPHFISPEVSPDGKQLLAWTAGSLPRSVSAVVMNVDGSAVHATPIGAAGMWFPDSKRVLTIQRGSGATPSRLVIMNVDGSNSRELLTEGVNVGMARAMSDGKTILIADMTRDPVTRANSWRWYSMAIDGSDRRALSMPVPEGQKVFHNVVPAHDGKRIAFLAIDIRDMTAPEKKHQSTLYTMNLDGSAPRAIATLQEDAGALAWSPDDRSIAVTDNFTPHPVPADFVPDANIVLIDVESGAVRPLTRHDRPFLDEHPSWSPDGHIYFQSNRDGVMDIYRMKADGSDVVRITQPSK